MALKRLSMTRGDTINYAVNFKKSDGTPYCIKNWVVHFTAKTHYSLSDAEASFQKIVTAFSDTTAGTDGSCSITLNPSDTINLDPGEYDFDIVVTTNSNQVYTVMKGKLDLEFDVTRLSGTAGSA